jgi:hypothetical protein
VNTNLIPHKNASQFLAKIPLPQRDVKKKR